MSKKQKVPKKQPTMETIQEGFKLSDFLSIEVCNPIKTQIDQIELCSPNVISDSPSSRGFSTNLRSPFPWPICPPTDRQCYPCPPLCPPWFFPFYSPFSFGTQYRGNVVESEIEPQTLSQEMGNVLEELQSLKAEIAELKKKIQ